MFGFEMFQSINDASVDALQKLRMITRVFGTPYSELASLAKEIMKAISYPQPMKWEYMVDSTTGLKILKLEKDSEALDRVRQLADELFK
jgi:hypothetical protein